MKYKCPKLFPYEGIRNSLESFSFSNISILKKNFGNKTRNQNLGTKFFHNSKTIWTIEMQLWPSEQNFLRNIFNSDQFFDILKQILTFSS